jgi:hypothetical protein
LRLEIVPCTADFLWQVFIKRQERPPKRFKKTARMQARGGPEEEGDFSKLLKPPVLGTRGTESTWLTNFQIQDIIGELVKEERHKEAGWLQMLALPRTVAAWRELYTSNKLHIFCDTCHAHHSVLILGPSAVQGRWFMYLDSLRADLRADLHILLDNHDFTEVFLRNLPRQRNSVCGFWVCEMVEQVMQAVRNPLAMPAPLRFGNCWPPEEHLVNKWRGFMARPHPQLDEGGDGGGAGDDESLLPASTTSAEGAVVSLDRGGDGGGYIYGDGEVGFGGHWVWAVDGDGSGGGQWRWIVDR